MINFIICSGSKDFANNIKVIVKNFMMNFDIDENIYLFNNYDNIFKNAVSKITGFKTFIFDIEDDKDPLINACKYVRKDLSDWNSIMLLVVPNSELMHSVLENGLFLFDVINREDDYEKKLKDILINVMKYYDNRDNCLTFEANRIIRKIDFREIIMIEKEKDSKRCLVRTSYGKYVINKSLKSVCMLLDNRFIKVSRSMIVNVDQIMTYDYSSNKIIFKNGMMTKEISRSCKKEISKIIKSYNDV